MKKTAILVAMKKEYDLLQSSLASFETSLSNEHVVIAMSGIGKVNAALTAARLILTEDVEQIISTGVAGGLDASLNRGDVVIGDRYAYHDVWCGNPNEVGQVQGLPTFFQSDETLLNHSRNIRVNFKTHFSLIVSGDKFITEHDDFERIKKDFPTAVACDMESAAIAQVCHLLDKPFISIRVVSDVVGKKDDNVAQYDDFWDQAPFTTFQFVQQLLHAL